MGLIKRIPPMKAEDCTIIPVRFDAGDDLCLSTVNRDCWPKASIKGLESGECISWHYHDVFKRDIERVYWNGKPGDECVIYVPEADLYDMDKLRALADGERFKQQKYSFFFYGVVERLLGRDVTQQGMSGLFAKGAV